MNTIAGLFFNSGEYVGGLARDRDFMGDVYNAYMRRGPGGDTGFSFWVGQVPSRGRDGVRAEFVPSTEFQARVSSVIAGGPARRVLARYQDMYLVRVPGTGALELAGAR